MMMPLRGALSPLGRGLGAAELAYLLYEAFTTDRAAGAVNGTVSESPVSTGGGATRTLTDTNGTISISGGLLSHATGATADDGTWWPIQARVPGKALVGAFVPSNTSGTIKFGWDSNQNAAIREALALVTTNGIAFTGDGVTFIYLGSYSATPYAITGILRSTGIYWFIKGGSFTYWTLLFITSTNTAAAYPGVQRGNSTSVFTADNIRIPDSLWLPTPLVSDGLGTAGTSDGLGHAEGIAGGLGAGGSGVVWTSRVGTVGVSGGKAIATALSGGRAIATVPAGAADVLHTAAMTRGTTGVGLVLRYVDVDNYVYAVRVASNIQVIKRVAGSETTLINTAATEVNGAELREICYGTKFRTYYNNVLIGAEQTIADAALQTPQAQGLIFFDTDSTADNLYIFARGTGNEYAALEAF